MKRTLARGLANGDLLVPVTTVLVLIALAVLPLPSPLREAVDGMRRSQLSAEQVDALTAGYYEGLLDSAARRGVTPAGLAGIVSGPPSPPDDWPKLHETDAVIWDEPYQRFRLRPGETRDYKGAALDVNELGLRDRPVTPDARDDVRRIALVGASISMGSGVRVDETFENLVEDALNAAGPRVEIVNFSVAGYRLTQLIDVIADRVSALQPDAVLLVLNDLAVNPNWARHVAWLVQEERDLKYPFLVDLVERAELTPDMDEAQMAERLASYRFDVAGRALRFAVTKARELGLPIGILIVAQPDTAETFRRRLEPLRPVLEELEVVVIDLLDAYDGHPDPRSLWLRPWDRHPTAAGHRRIADGMLEAIEQRPEVADFMLGTSPSPETTR